MQPSEANELVKLVYRHFPAAKDPDRETLALWIAHLSSYEMTSNTARDLMRLCGDHESVWPPPLALVKAVVRQASRQHKEALAEIEGQKLIGYQMTDEERENNLAKLKELLKSIADRPGHQSPTTRERMEHRGIISDEDLKIYQDELRARAGRSNFCEDNRCAAADIHLAEDCPYAAT